MLSFSSPVEAAPVVQIPDVSDRLQTILQDPDRSNKYRYPTDLTRGILPKGIHSHNDYWQDVPFYKALAYGAISIEADVWFVSGKLYLGHDTGALTSARTLSGLYIEPLLSVLRQANPPNPASPSEPTFRGVFDRDTEQTLYLFIDFKTEPSEGTLKAVMGELEPLRSAGYLTTWYQSNDSIVTRPVTAVGTGKMNLESVLGQGATRDLFYDGPLFNITFENFTENAKPSITPVCTGQFTAAFGQVIRTDFFERNQTALGVLRDQLKAAHDRKIKVRYWDTPGWPIGTRNYVWRTLVNEGLDLLNFDDPEGVANFWEGRG
ncbi:PLC-like phosphodiesterase [Phyllosticta capitalensis]